MDEARETDVRRLVPRVAAALAEYHGEVVGNFACHAQAATNMAARNGVLIKVFIELVIFGILAIVDYEARLKHA
jgi:hypothetical protein